MMPSASIASVTHCALVRLRRVGELLKAMPKNSGAKGVGPIAVKKKDHNPGKTDQPPTLETLGIGKNDSSTWQKLADIMSTAKHAHCARF